MRKTREELNNIKKKFNVDMLWSFSRFDAYRTSPYEYMLKYVKHVAPDNESVNCYGVLGGAVHDCMESFYDGTIKYEDLPEEFDDIFTTNIDIVDLKFDRANKERNDSIKHKYYNDIMHFFKNYKPIPYKMINEQFVTIKVSDDIVMQGYIDAVYKDDNDIYTIVDYKTSTKYSGQAIQDHSAQLVLYSEALRQLGIPKDKIRCCWNFLKYVNVDVEQVNGKIKERIIERQEIGSSLKASAKTWLKKLGYADDMDTYIDELVMTGDIKVLPEDVQAKFKISDCYVYIDDIWDFYENVLKPEIINTIDEINEKVEEFKITEDEMLFWDSDESLQKQTYYFNNLSDYKVATLKPYKNYLDRVTAEKNGDLLGIAPSSTVQSTATKKETEEDYSWLDEL